MTTPHKEITSGLRFPEGPVAMPDGSVMLVEIARQTLTRVMPDGKQHVIAKLGGGPNGAAMGPGGKIYVTNNGGFNWIERPDRPLIPTTAAAAYKGGSIQVVDPETGKFETLYDSCDGRRLNSANDLCPRLTTLAAQQLRQLYSRCPQRRLPWETHDLRQVPLATSQFP